MSAPVKFGITAAVVIGVVALGYYLYKKQQEQAAAASDQSKAKTMAATA